MTSRTRRNVKADTENPKSTKLDPADEDDTLKKEKDGTPRRSLRHSPGQSPTSPPRKTRRLLKESQESVENTSNNLMRTLSTSPSDQPPSHISSTLSTDSTSNITSKATPNHSNSSTGGRSTRSGASSPQGSPKKSMSSTSRRSPRSKSGSVTDFDQEEPGGRLDPLNEDHVSSGELIPEQTTSPTKETETGKRHKRVLSCSPDSSNSNPHQSNGNVAISVPRKHRRVEKENIKTNGTSTLPTAQDNDTPKSDPDSLLNSSTSSVSKDAPSVIDSLGNLDLNNDKSSVKRKLGSATNQKNEETDLNCKKNKIENVNSLNSAVSPVKTSKPTNTECEIKDVIDSIDKLSCVPQVVIDDSIDMQCKAELFLSEFGLTDVQIKEIVALLPDKFKDSESLEITEELIPLLLADGLTIKCISSPRFNKLLRQLLLNYCEFDISIEKKHSLCKNAHDWSKERKTVNLRHELELALMVLYFNTGFFRKAEETATGLFNETKKLQDKEKTVKACLCLSKAYHAMGNIAKARANITTAKTEALKIYTPPNLQAELDLQSGIMQVAEEKDMETAFSYFKEAATGFTEKPLRARALKYMLLTKLLVNKPEEGDKAVHSSVHVGDIDEGVEALLGITKAAVACSLKDFKAAREKYIKVLSEDLVVSSVLDELYGKMLEKNLLSIIMPYERIQVLEIASKISLPKDEVERRLSQMILDKDLSAQLDHRDDCLYVYGPEPKDTVFTRGVETIGQLDKTLSLLNKRVTKIL